MEPEVEIKRGQTWRRIRDGRLVEVERYEASIDDVIWRTPDGVKPTRRGACYGSYFRRDYELVDANE